jgi:TonB-linked SusC/RagA family outer membrane protein
MQIHNIHKERQRTGSLLMKMKFMVIFLISGMNIGYALNLYSQSVILSLDVKDKSIEEVISEIETQSEFVFIYEKALDVKKKVSVHADNEQIGKILDKLFGSTDIQYVISDRQIALSRKDASTQSPAQTGIRVSGSVSDDNGEPIPGVNVIVKGTAQGIATDMNGEFSIMVPSDTCTLEFRYIGYNTQEAVVGNRRVIAVTLREATAEIGEVTVVAFGQQKKESVIGSISTVNPGLLKVPSSNLTTTLAGNLAGVIAYQRSGEPGQDNADFFVRGITTFGTNVNPLILIDNVELTATDLARLRPDDIESFSILKDATATALYGARGANGVVLVTTKQGKEGPVKVSFRFENSISAPTRNIEIADPVTYMKLHNEAILTRDPTQATLYTQEKIEMTESGRYPLIYPVNNWKELLFKDYTMNQRANLSFSGGGGVARYYVSGSYYRDNGIMNVDKRNNFNNNISINNYNIRANVNIDLTKTSELIVRLSANFEDYQGPMQGGKQMYDYIVHSNPVMFPAYYPVDEDHKYVEHIMFGNYNNNYLNPYAEMTRGYKDRSRSQILAQLEMKQNLKFITEGLSARGMLNISRLAQFGVDRAYTPFFYQIGQYNRQTGEYSLMETRTGTEYLSYAELPSDRVMNSTFYFEGTLNYARDFDLHNVSGLLVFMARQSFDANAGSLQRSLPSRSMGLSGRATYGFDRRYFLEFNFGYNGTERFDKDNRWGFFPSVGAAWSISNEKFWEDIKPTVSNLKLRYSYGLIGNDQIGTRDDRFFYLSEVNMNADNRQARFGLNLDRTIFGVYTNRYANPLISWETSAKQNIALELGLWSKLTLIAEFFTEYRDNILMNRASIPSTMGLTAAVRANVGEASGKGVDLNVEYQQSWTNDFWTSARANFTYATSKYEVYEEPIYEEPWRTRVGQSLRQEYGYIAERLFVDDFEAENAPPQYIGNNKYGGGDIKYLDMNKDGRIDDADRVPIGNPTVPEIVYGFGFSTGYKNLDFSAFFQGNANQSFWINASSTSPFVADAQMLKAYSDSYWSEENQDVYAVWPRLSPVIHSNNVTRSTWFMRDATFLRLKQMEMGFTLPSKWTDKMHMSGLRFYVSGTNLLLFSKFKLWDVEMAGEGLGYPIQRVFNIGLNLSFN